MPDCKFDVILVCKGEDFKHIAIVAENINKFFAADSMYIICPSENIEEHNHLSKQIKNLQFIDENKLLPQQSINFDHYQLPGFPSRRFWYYQQFLKIAFCASKLPSNTHVLIWDADTIPLRNIIFFKDDKIQLTTSNDEFHQPYFDTIKKLFGRNFKTQNESFISQHLMVNCEHMGHMLKELEERFNSSWPEAIMSNLCGTSYALFSEYETYANYVLQTYPNKYDVRQLPWYRKGGYLIDYVSQEQLAKEFAFIAVEKFNRNKIKASIRSLLFRLFNKY